MGWKCAVGIFSVVPVVSVRVHQIAYRPELTEAYVLREYWAWWLVSAVCLAVGFWGILREGER